MTEAATTPTGYAIYNASIAGSAELLMHNGQLSDPTCPIVREMKKVTAKKKKVDADFEALADLEFKGSLYVTGGKIVIPARVLESMLVEGARSTKEGQVALAGTFVEQDVTFSFDGPQTVEERLADVDSRLVVGVKVQRNRVMRCRPIFRNWGATFRISALSSTVTEEMLKNWITSAGILKGLGDWRPRYGRFALKNLEKLT